MKYLVSAVLLVASFAAMFHYCSPAGINKTGHEYMPDMVHPVTYEANVLSDYYWNHWEKESAFTSRQLSQPRASVPGTIPRGQTAMFYGGGGHSVGAANNGGAPFYYKNDATDAGKGDRERCSADITANPVPVSAAGLARGKALYDTYCGLCHGKEGDGNGYLYNTDENPEAKYPAKPANFTTTEFLGANEGRYYYAMMFGKNVMGSYADKLSYEERWEVMHHIRSLQAAKTNSEYSAGANTFIMVQADNAAKWAAEQRAAAAAVPK